MDDLVQFLQTRLDDDERKVRELSNLIPRVEWVGDRAAVLQRQLERRLPRAESAQVLGAMKPELDDLWGIEGTLMRGTPMDPARALADIEAKRRILDEHGIVHRDIGWLDNGNEETGEIPVCGTCVAKHSHYPRREDVPEGPCRTLRLLAQPYADHPDYRDKWRP